MSTISYYSTPQALQNKVDEYFDWCFVYEEKYGRSVVKVINPPTFSGLARYLGFSSRASLLNYADKENPLFEDVLNDAKLRIEEFCETKLMTARGNPVGIIFELKNNAGWDDMSKQQLTGSDNKPIVFTWGVDEQDKLYEESLAADTKQALPPAPKKKVEPIEDAVIVEETKDKSKEVSEETYQDDGSFNINDYVFE